jgi:hypothetical protein
MIIFFPLYTGRLGGTAKFSSLGFFFKKDAVAALKHNRNKARNPSSILLKAGR